MAYKFFEFVLTVNIMFFSFLFVMSTRLKIYWKLSLPTSKLMYLTCEN